MRTLSKHAVVLVHAIGSPMQRLDYTFYIESVNPQRQHAEQFTGCFGRSFRQMHDHNIWLSIKLWRSVLQISHNSDRKGSQQAISPFQGCFGNF